MLFSSTKKLKMIKPLKIIVKQVPKNFLDF